MSRQIGSLWFSGALLFALASGGASQDAQKKSEDFIIKGQIIENDDKDKVRQNPCKVHAVKLRKGKEYQIDLESVDFDSYLRVEDSAGSNLTQNDDGGNGLNSRLRLTPEKDDVFRIIATTFAGGVGNYTLTVKEMGNVPPAKKVIVGKNPVNPIGGNKVELPKGDKIETPTAQKAVEFQGQLQNNDPNDPVLRGPARILDVELPGDRIYQLDLMSGDFDSLLRVTDAQGRELGRDDDGGEGLNSRLMFKAPVKGAYKVVITSLGAGTGGYQFEMRDLGKVEKLDATKVHEVGKDGLIFSSELTANDPLDAVQNNSHCQIIQVKLAANKTYVIDHTSGRFDAFLRVEDSDKKSIEEDDDGGSGLNSRIVLQPAADGTYRVVATSLTRAVGPYVLMIREQK